MKCNNINVNVNGLELKVFPPFLANSGLATEAVEGNTGPRSFAGNGDTSQINDFRFICINNNNNTVIQEPIPPTSPEPPEPPTSPEPPEPPTTASLTVNKEVSGCDDIQEFPNRIDMNCFNDMNWIPCIDSNIRDTAFCERLPANLFDIEVLDDQNNQIQQFEGSLQGTTIQNLQPGTYIVNETKIPNTAPTPRDQLLEVFTDPTCIGFGFDGAGRFFTSENAVGIVIYDICFEYADEQGNDCSSITLAA
ncbi:MAG: hypothetical protein AB7P56_06920 [Nitrososphaeraceae archaeon]